MYDSKIVPLFAPAATVADAIRASAHQRPMQGAYITAITCTRDISAIVDTLHKQRGGALEMAKDAKEAGDGYTSGVMTGHAAGLAMALHALENWLNGSAPAPAPLGEHTPEDYSREDQTQAEIDEDRAALACTDCGQPADWGRTAAGVCRRCHEDARRDPSEDTEGPSVRGH
jgi:hypothetical protein